jgi:hypothetical protein
VIRELDGAMAKPTFNPGFRLSFLDVLILCAGLIGSIVLGLQTGWAGFVVMLVVLHFFLFCNVFRISRPPELIWAAAFVVLGGATILTEFPGWIATMVISVALSSHLIWRETRKPHYHGICWKKWNPALPDWWDAQHKPGDNGH